MSEKLAIDGGDPVRASLLPYGRQCLDQTDREALIRVFDSDFITRGPQVRTLEEKMAELLQVPHAVAFHSATAGLHAVMAMCELGPGKRVAVPALTFAATANSVEYAGGEIEFVDVEEECLTIDLQRLGAPGNYAAVYAVDFAGQLCDYEALDQWRAGERVLIVSDAAHSLGALKDGKNPAQLADVAVFSFHPVKSVTMGEGGVVCVKESWQRDFLMKFRNHGIGTQFREPFFDQEILGFNYHVTEFQAALGLSQINKLETFIDRRNQIAQAYDEFFSEHSSRLRVLARREGHRSAYHLYPIRLKQEAFKVDRNQFLRALKAENIGAQVHYVPVYWHSYYQKKGLKRGLCPVAEEAFEQEISLPIFPGMSDRDQEDVQRAFLKLFAAYAL